MEQRFLIDTNVIIDVLGTTMPDKTKKIIASLTPIISAVTYIETLGWHKATPQQLVPLRSFMNAATILPIDQPVINKTVLIRQQKKISLGDALIAATALVHGLTLMTRNINDFENIDGLNVIDPWRE